MKQHPTGGSSPGTWERRRPEAAWVRFLYHSTLKQHQNPMGACPSCMRLERSRHHGGSADSRQEQLQSWMRGIRMMAIRR